MQLHVGQLQARIETLPARFDAADRDLLLEHLAGAPFNLATPVVDMRHPPEAQPDQRQTEHEVRGQRQPTDRPQGPQQQPHATGAQARRQRTLGRFDRVLDDHLDRMHQVGGVAACRRIPGFGRVALLRVGHRVGLNFGRVARCLQWITQYMTRMR